MREPTVAHLGDQFNGGFSFDLPSAPAHFVPAGAQGVGLGDDLAPTNVQLDDPVDVAGQATVRDGLLDPVGLVPDGLDAQHL